MTGTVTWDVTADVAQALAEGEDEVRWLVGQRQRTPRISALYYSKEGATRAGDPRLAPNLIIELEEPNAHAGGVRSTRLRASFWATRKRWNALARRWRTA